MSDEEVITKAEELGFRFYKFKNQWKWSVIAPDKTSITCEQGAPEGMKWLREKLTHFLKL